MANLLRSFLSKCPLFARQRGDHFEFVASMKASKDLESLKLLLHMRFLAVVQAGQLIFTFCMPVGLNTLRVDGDQVRVVETRLR